jgi:hypothetical protein
MAGIGKYLFQTLSAKCQSVKCFSTKSRGGFESPQGLSSKIRKLVKTIKRKRKEIPFFLLDRLFDKTFTVVTNTEAL